MKKDLNKIVKTAEKQGWDIKITGGGHLKWTGPEGQIVFSARTPSDHRAIQNIIHELKIRGYEPPKR